MKIPILSLAILGGQLVAAGVGQNSIGAVVDNVQSYYTGFLFREQNFNPARLMLGYGPWLAKGLIMKFARPLGAAPKVPYLPVSLS